MRASPFVSLSRLAVIGPVLFAIAACSGGGGGGASAPVAVADAYVFPGTSQLTVAAPGVLSNDSGGSLTASSVGPVSNGTLVLHPDGSFNYTSNDGVTPDAFSYKATNANGSSSVVQVNLAPNTPPLAVNACLPTPTSTSLNGTLTATDEPSSQPDVYSGPVVDPIGPLKGNVVVNANGTFTYTPNVPASGPAYVGMDKFKFQVTDKFGATSTGIATVLINGAVRIMPLGDSITQGVWYDDTLSQCNDGSPDYLGNCPASGVRVSYRQKLYNDLEALSANYTVNMVGSLSNGSVAGLTQPNHEGHPAYTAAQIASGVNTYLGNNPPDIILLHIGTNNFYSTGITQNTADVNTLLDSISTWAQGYYGVLPAGEYPITVYVARIIQTVQGQTGSILNSDITTFNNDVAGIAGNRTDVRVIIVNQQTGATLTYTVDTSSTCLTTGVCSAGDMASVLHPNPSGYTKMADMWKTDLQASGVLPTCP